MLQWLFDFHAANLQPILFQNMTHPNFFSAMRNTDTFRQYILSFETTETLLSLRQNITQWA